MRKLLTILVAYVFLTYSFLSDNYQDIQFEPPLLNHLPTNHAIGFFISDSKRYPLNHFNSKRKHKSKTKKPNTLTLSVFKGREAKLNHAIFKTLAIDGPQTISELQKRLSKQKNLQGTYYASLTKRIRCLQSAGYINQISYKTSRIGFQAAIYDICAKALLATFLNGNNPQDLFGKVTEKEAMILLSDLINTNLQSKKEQKLKA